MEKIDIYEFFEMLRDNTIEQYNTREELLKAMVIESAWYCTIRNDAIKGYIYLKLNQNILKNEWFLIFEAYRQAGYISKETRWRDTVDMERYRAAIRYTIGDYVIQFEHFYVGFDIEEDKIEDDPKLLDEFVKNYYDILGGTECYEEEI